MEISPSMHTIQSERLDLRSLSPQFLMASLAGDIAMATTWLGTQPPSDWLCEEELMRVRLGQLQNDPGLQPWLLRAVILRSSGVMIGHITFHTAPNPEYLQPIAPDGIELGYTIYLPFRRQGYAREAVAALMAWAEQEHAIHRFVLSISPDNEPSLQIARHFRFRKVGSHLDEGDGVEDIYILERNIPLEVQSDN